VCQGIDARRRSIKWGLSKRITLEGAHNIRENHPNERAEFPAGNECGVDCCWGGDLFFDAGVFQPAAEGLLIDSENLGGLTLVTATPFVDEHDM
jgi:hypothetical protein